VNVVNGQLVCQPVGDALGMACVPIETLMG